jgi:hypothetical protein
LINARIEKTSNSNPIPRALAAIRDRAVYVGIPASSARQRKETLLDMAGKVSTKSKKGKSKKQRLVRAASQDINNAELLFIQSRGSQARGIPARPVLEPAINADGNRELIGRELATVFGAALKGDEAGIERNLKRTGIAAQNAARKWFTDPRNGWAPNSPRTIAAKGSDRPLIDTGALRNAITYVVK